MCLILTSYIPKSGALSHKNPPNESRARETCTLFLQGNFQRTTVTGPNVINFVILHHPIWADFAREHLQKQTDPRNLYPFLQEKVLLVVVPGLDVSDFVIQKCQIWVDFPREPPQEQSHLRNRYPVSIGKCPTWGCHRICCIRF